MLPTQRLELPPSKVYKTQIQLMQQWCHHLQWTRDPYAALRGVLGWSLQEPQSIWTLSRSSFVLLLSNLNSVYMQSLFFLLADHCLLQHWPNASIGLLAYRNTLYHYWDWALVFCTFPSFCFLPSSVSTPKPRHAQPLCTPTLNLACVCFSQWMSTLPQHWVEFWLCSRLLMGYCTYLCLVTFLLHVTNCGFIQESKQIGKCILCSKIQSNCISTWPKGTAATCFDDLLAVVGAIMCCTGSFGHKALSSSCTGARTFCLFVSTIRPFISISSTMKCACKTE